MFKQKLNVSSFRDMDQRKALSSKVYNMMKDNPAEVFRILTNPEYSRKTINEKSASRN